MHLCTQPSLNLNLRQMVQPKSCSELSLSFGHDVHGCWVICELLLFIPFILIICLLICP